MTPPNLMVIGLEIGKFREGGGIHPPPALPDSEEPSLFRVNGMCICVSFYPRKTPLFDLEMDISSWNQKHFDK